MIFREGARNILEALEKGKQHQVVFENLPAISPSLTPHFRRLSIICCTAEKVELTPKSRGKIEKRRVKSCGISYSTGFIMPVRRVSSNHESILLETGIDVAIEQYAFQEAISPLKEPRILDTWRDKNRRPPEEERREMPDETWRYGQGSTDLCGVVKETSDSDKEAGCAISSVSFSFPILFRKASDIAEQGPNLWGEAFPAQIGLITRLLGISLIQSSIPSFRRSSSGRNPGREKHSQAFRE